MPSNGFVKIHRSLLTWEWYQNSNIVRVFLHLLLKANHQDQKWQGILIRRGQLITSLDHLATEIGGLSVMQVRTALNKLKVTSEITSEPTSQFTVITINKYNDYQENNNPINKRITNEQQTDNKRITTNKNDKNEKNDKKDIDIHTSQFSSLSDITPSITQEIADKYEVTPEYVDEIKLDMEVWQGKNPKTNHYKDYRLALMTWVRKKKEDLVLKRTSFKRGGVVDARNL